VAEEDEGSESKSLEFEALSLRVRLENERNFVGMESEPAKEGASQNGI